MRLLVLAVFWIPIVGGAVLTACPSTPAPVTPLPDADAACVVDERIDQARLIRTADGSPLVIHCQDGAP